MTSDKIGKRLHDKYTRGEILTAREFEQLEAWYQQLDNAEAVMLDKNAGNSALELNLKNLLENTHQKLTEMAQRLQETEQENNLIRVENRKIRKKLEKLLVQRQA